MTWQIWLVWSSIMSDMTDKEIVLSMIEGFKKVKGINQMPTLEVLKLIEMRLQREDEFNEFVETARNVLADT